MFNVTGEVRWGDSSLNTFADGIDKTWPGRQGLRVTHK